MFTRNFPAGLWTSSTLWGNQRCRKKEITEPVGKEIEFLTETIRTQKCANFSEGSPNIGTCSFEERIAEKFDYASEPKEFNRWETENKQYCWNPLFPLDLDISIQNWMREQNSEMDISH